MNRDKIEWIKNLNVGNEVILHCWDWNYSSYEKCKIDKITPSGFIKVKGMLFNPDTGRLSGKGKYVILNPNDDSVNREFEEYERNDFVKNTIYTMKNTISLKYEQAEKIMEILNNNNNEEEQIEDRK